MADVVPNGLKQTLLQGGIDGDNDSFKLALLDSNHSNNIDSQEFWGDVNGNEVSGSGYSAGGQAISNTGTSQDDTDDEGVFDGDDVTWSNSTITASYAVVYKDTGSASTSNIVCIFDFGGSKSSDNGDFTVSFGSEGILNIG